MRLCSMEMQGFKSFPDKIRLEFKEGITAVVGPNGSGKSNIADAMRWVLGEQSSKTLRGGKMEDVIFGGTQLRRPQGFAMVAMTMDNRDRTLDFDGDEVTVSRKLYRSGDSEYSINGVNVRLKDVHQLFMDTGLGRDGYSIIGQGKIAEIVSAKSKERREIFEEAAGISKYRYRREEAQRHLNNAQENLLRLQDILTELEDRVGPLRIQSEKAEKFLKLSAEKKELEVSLWVHTLEQSKKVLREQEDKLQISRGQYGLTEQTLQECQAALEECAAQLRSVAVEMDDHQLLQKTADARQSELSKEIALLENDIAHGKTTKEQLLSQLSDLTSDKVDLEQKIQSQREKVQTQDALLTGKQSRREVLQAQLSEVNGSLGTLQKDVEGLKERRFALNQSISDIKVEGATAASRLEETVRHIENLRDNAVVRDENVLQLEKERTDCKSLLETLGESIEGLQNQQKGFQMRRQGQVGRLETLEKQRRELLEKAREHENRARLLADMEKRMEGFGPSVKYIAGLASSGALQGVFGPVSRLFQVSEQHALAVEIALGGALQNIVVDTEQTAKRAIGMLKSQQKGRATFLPLTTVKGSVLSEPWLGDMEGFVGIAVDLTSCEERFRGVLSQLLGRIVVAEDLDCAVAIAKRGSYRFRVVTLDGQLVNAGGSMTGGYVTRSAGILSRSHEIDGLLEQAKALQQKSDAMEGDFRSAKETLSATDARLLGISGELQTAQEDLIRTQTLERQLEKNYAQAVELKEQAYKEYDGLLDKMEKLKASGQSHEEMLRHMQERLNEVAESLSQRNEEISVLHQRQSETQGELSALELEELSAQKDKEALLTMLAQFESQQDSGAEQTRLCQEKISACDENERVLLAKITELQGESEALTKKVATVTETLAQLRVQRDVLQARESGIRAKERAAMEEKESVGRELTRLEEKYTAMQQEFESVVTRLWEEYELTRSQAEELATLVQDVPAANRRLSELKNQIKALGSVNVAAVEEYKEVKARYDALLNQTKDAERTRKELLKLIENLTAEMQTMFSQSFRVINGYFSQIFVQLFGGGQAGLSLSDPENVLESGVDISVQPPGKVIGSLTSLSGGEQAFVAIALYFAILKVRPSPFVLLDEIEAALDDVNVAKYAAYLRTISDKTQFITITHRRGTMEEADVLYGVTMEEKGVSKLLVLQVSELESKLGM